MSRPVVLSLAAALAAVLLLAPPANAADQIAYQCNSDICVVNPDSGTPTNLTNTGGASEWYPAWSPDGTRIAYGALLPSANWDTYMLNVASPGTAVQITNTPDGAESNSYPPVWSPGGTRIASVYHPNSSAENDEIIVSNADGTGGDVHVGSTTSDEAYPSYSSDGSKIMFYRDSGSILIANADGSDTGTSANAFGFDPKWSPDGTRVVTGVYSGPNNWVRVFRIDGSASPVTLGPGGNSSTSNPEWSPDGTKIAFQQDNFVRIANADGSGTITNITTPRGIVLAGGNSWSPDGTRIAFVGYAPSPSSSAVIYVANSDGSGTARVVADNTTNNTEPVWKPDPNAQPPVDPPVDPPVNPTRPPVTISLASFRNPSLIGNHHMLLAGVSCSYPSPTAIAAGCKFDANAKTPMVAPAGLSAAAVGKKKPIVFAQGSTELAYNESGEIEIPITKLGKKVLKRAAGKKIKLDVTIEQRVGDDPVVTTKKTLKLKIPKKGKKK